MRRETMADCDEWFQFLGIGYTRAKLGIAELKNPNAENRLLMISDLAFGFKLIESWSLVGTSARVLTNL